MGERGEGEVGGERGRVLKPRGKERVRGSGGEEIQESTWGRQRELRARRREKRRDIRSRGRKRGMMRRDERSMVSAIGVEHGLFKIAHIGTDGGFSRGSDMPRDADGAGKGGIGRRRRRRERASNRGERRRADALKTLRRGFGWRRTRRRLGKRITRRSTCELLDDAAEIVLGDVVDLGLGLGLLLWRGRSMEVRMRVRRTREGVGLVERALADVLAELVDAEMRVSRCVHGERLIVG